MSKTELTETQPEPRNDTLDSQLLVRCHTIERIRWREAAQRAGVSLSKWVRTVLNHAARSD